MAPVVFLEGTSAISTILSTVGTILSSVTTWMTSITTWIVGDDLALLFFGLMLILFAVKMVLTLVHNAQAAWRQSSYCRQPALERVIMLQDLLDLFYLLLESLFISEIGQTFWSILVVITLFTIFRHLVFRS